MRRTIHCRRPAMATLFEAWLVGDDDEQLAAVGEAILDEVQRVETVLSRFDRGAEAFRVSREARVAPVRLSCELYDVVEDCLRRRAETDGYFDPFTPPSADADDDSSPIAPDAVRLDPSRRTLQFLDPRVRFDFGGYGKGYALDMAANILDRFGVDSALLHGGTSSVLARGTQADGRPWRVGLADPFVAARAELMTMPLVDAALSTSAAWNADHTDADLFNPRTGLTVTADEACCVTAPTAALAEVYSTAFTAMGHRRTLEFLATRSEQSLEPMQVLYFERSGGGTTIHSLDEAVR